MRRTGNEDNLQVVDLTSQRLGLTHREATLSPDVARHRLGPLGTLLIVSDGMGGAAAGEVASEMAVEIVAREMLRYVNAGVPPRDAMRYAADSANAAIWERSQNESAIRGLGATLTAVYLSAQEAVVSQVGDSRAYLIRGGTIRQLTEDQSWAAAAKKAGMQAANVPSNVILQALGTQRTVNTDITTEIVQPNDIFLLCSDGLSNKVEEHELLSYVTTADSLTAAAEALVKLANDRGGEDNITVILAQISLERPDAVGDLRTTQLLTSANASDEANPHITPRRVTADLQGYQTRQNLGVPTHSDLSPVADTAFVTQPLSPSGQGPASPSPRLSTGGKLFVVLALAAVAVIVSAGVAAMFWILQARAEKQSEAGKKNPVPLMHPPKPSPDAKPAASSPTESGRIGRTDDGKADDFKLDVDEVEKKLDQAKQQMDELAGRTEKLPGYEAWRKTFREKYDRLTQLKDALGRRRRQEVKDGDPSLSDIAEEVRQISRWLEEKLPPPLRKLEGAGAKALL
ncbi:MAG: protein phosphatase 2C domain-containing protein [Chloracidobacterium sp.]|nr:protein phosphatase 2C domain-containing protein [Chloracidobacterium sp.]MDW8217358.1 protein phosphatase 2C domain-containing protein [Acidobacteriota bacterium]